MTNICLKRLALLLALGLLGNMLAGCYYLGRKGNLYLPDEAEQGTPESTSTRR